MPKKLMIRILVGLMLGAYLPTQLFPAMFESNKGLASIFIGIASYASLAVLVYNLFYWFRYPFKNIIIKTISFVLVIAPTHMIGPVLFYLTIIERNMFLDDASESEVK